MTSSSWLGLVLGNSNMTAGADMIQIDGDNQVVHDKVSAGYQYPSSDTVDHIEASPTWTQDSNDGSLTVTFKRLLDT